MFGFTWHIYGLPEDDPRRTYVEFTLEPTGSGTRLTVVESGFAQLTDDAFRQAYDGNTRAGPASWVNWSTTSMPPDIEAIAEQVFVALADPAGAPSWPRWPRRARRPRPTWPGACRSRGRPSPSTWPCSPRRAW